GGKSQSVVLRMQGLGITEVHLGVNRKIEVYDQFLKDRALNKDQVLYIGDDIPDVPVMKEAGVSACPSDAVEEAKSASDYISPYAGGAGCVRDIIEKVLKIQGKWFDADPSAQDDSIPSR